jgi:DNA-directed RNA polymerase subunit K/omega
MIRIRIDEAKAVILSKFSLSTVDARCHMGYW